MPLSYGTSESQNCRDCKPKEPFCTTCNFTCDVKVDALCTIYHLNNPGAVSNLTCLGLPNGVSVETFMEAVDEKLCEIQAAGNPLIANDTESINFTTSGIANHTIEADVIISPDSGNNLEIRSNGLFSSGSGSVDCDGIKTLFSTDANQNNTVNRADYDFLTTGLAGCLKVSPPTGFAVLGPSRNSAFGAMEWFSTFALALASATSGETVLLYSGTSDNFTLKPGVNFFGIGQITVTGTLIINQNTNCSISNITFGGTSPVSVGSNLTCNIITTNVTVLNNIVFRGNIRWEGGTFLDNTKTLTVQDSAKLNNAYIERHCGLTGSGTISNCEIVYLDNASSDGIYVNCTTDGHVTLHNCKVTVNDVVAIRTFSLVDGSRLTLTNNVGISNSSAGMYMHCGFVESNSSHIYANGNTGRSVTGNGIEVVSSLPVDGTGISQGNWTITNCFGYSTFGAGIFTINGNLKSCAGYSENGQGILIGGTDEPSNNILITDCIGESRNSNGLKALRDVFIIGGTYVSMLNTSLGNPILIDNNRIGTPTGYMIIGVKTYARNASAYAINLGPGHSTTPMGPVRISGCQFTSQTQLTNVLGIAPTIPLRSVTIDSYGNIR